MSRFSLPLVAGVLLVVVGCAPEEDRVKQARAVTEIERLGGKVKRDESDPDMPVVEVNLDRATDADAALKQAALFPRLRKLQSSQTKVGDAGLKALKGLTGLERLMVYDVPLTDEDLKNLGNLTGLKVLVIGHTNITDA